MVTHDALEENFRFLVMEVESLIRATFGFLNAPTRELYGKIVSRDDYVDNLKTIIENKCYSEIHTRSNSLSKGDVNRIRAIQVMGVNLERIADFCVNIVGQTGYLTDHAFLHNYNYKEIFVEIERAVSQVLGVYRNQDLGGALSICKAEHELDRMYKASFDRIMSELRTGLNVQNLITVLFIFRYLERVGDSLLNIGEALMMTILGEKIKIEQFEALQQTLSKTGFSGPITDIDFQSIWGGRSGCRIGRVDQREGGGGPHGDEARESDIHGSIYKEGVVDKIEKEKENLDRWARIFPGLVAHVFSYHVDEEQDKASLLVEFLPGCTLDEVVLTGDEELVTNSLFVLTQTMSDVWENTLEKKPIPVNYTEQIRSRLPAVRQVHPDFERLPQKLGSSRIDSTEELLKECAELEKELGAPFSVFIHGDFNINNIVYNHTKERIHLIDVYRSRQFDYVQDVSVFIASNFRMPIFDHGLRARLNWVAGEFYSFGRQFAERQGDETYQARLALALARSFFTSTRFELNFEFAKIMFKRGHFLLEKLISHRDRKWENFRLPTAVLYF